MNIDLYNSITDLLQSQNHLKPDFITSIKPRLYEFCKTSNPLKQAQEIRRFFNSLEDHQIEVIFNL